MNSTRTNSSLGRVGLAREDRTGSATARAGCWFESCGRAHATRQPGVCVVLRRGCHAACAVWGMTRTTTSPRFGLEVASARRASRSALTQCEAHRLRQKSSFGLAFGGVAWASSSAGRCPAWALHRGLLGAGAASRDRGRWRVSRRPRARGFAQGCGARSLRLSRCSHRGIAGRQQHRERS